MTDEMAFLVAILAGGDSQRRGDRGGKLGIRALEDVRVYTEGHLKRGVTEALLNGLRVGANLEQS